MDTVQSTSLCYLEKSGKIFGVSLSTQRTDCIECVLSSSGIVIVEVAYAPDAIRRSSVHYMW